MNINEPTVSDEALNTRQFLCMNLDSTASTLCQPMSYNVFEIMSESRIQARILASKQILISSG